MASLSHECEAGQKDGGVVGCGKEKLFLARMTRIVGTSPQLRGILAQAIFSVYIARTLRQTVFYIEIFSDGDARISMNRA